MTSIPKNEQDKMVNLISGQAKRFGFNIEDYLRKVWYHEEAAKLGEYVAMCLLEDILSLLPAKSNKA